MTCTTSNGNHSDREESLASVAEAGAASRLAEILLIGFERCDLEGRPLSELQKLDLLASALTVFDGQRAQLERQFRIHTVLSELGPEVTDRAKDEPVVLADAAASRSSRVRAAGGG